MDIGIDLTVYDLVISAIFVFFMVRGIWVGFLNQLTVIIALYIGYLVAGQYHDKLLPFLRGVSENPQVVFLLAYAVLFACTYVLTMLLGKALTGVVNLTIAGWFDKVLGALFGAVKALILAILLHMLLTTFLSADTPLLRQCRFCPYLSEAAALFQQLIKDEKLRQSFDKKKPAISDQTVTPPAAPPSLIVPEKSTDKKMPTEQAPVKALPSVE